MKTTYIKIKVSTQPYNYSDCQRSSSYKANSIYTYNKSDYNDVITVFPTIQEKKSVRKIICTFFDRLKSYVRI